VLDVYLSVYQEFTDKSVGERTVKVVQQLVKLEAKTWCHFSSDPDAMKVLNTWNVASVVNCHFKIKLSKVHFRNFFCTIML